MVMEEASKWKVLEVVSSVGAHGDKGGCCFAGPVWGPG